MYSDAVIEQRVPDWAAITAVVLGITAFAAAQGLVYPLVSLVLEGRGVPAGLIGLNGGAFAAGLASATLLVAPATARMAGDRLIVVSLLLYAGGVILMATTGSLVAWFVFRALIGVAAGFVFILSEAWLATACPDRLRGRISGLYGMGMAVGFAGGPLVIPLVGVENGFGFVVLAVYLASVALALAVLSRRTRTKPAAIPLAAVFRFTRAAPLLVVMMLVFGFADIAAISGLPIYLVRAGHGEALAAVSITALALPTALAQPLVGLMLDRLPRPLVVTGCSAIAGLAFCVLPAMESVVAIMAAIAVLGITSFGLYTCALTMMGDAFRGGMLSAGSAVFSLVYALGSGIGATAVGAAMSGFSAASGPVVAGLVLVAYAVAFALIVRRPA